MFRLRLASVLIGLATAAHSLAAGQAPLELVAAIPLPGVKGRIDHFAVDIKGGRLFVAALGNDTLEVLDTGTNRRVTSLRGFGEPQGVLFLAEQNVLFVANGSADRVDVLDGRGFKTLKKIEGLPDADNLRFDAVKKQVVVGYGSGALRMLDAATGAATGEIALPAHPEAFQLEMSGGRVYVNVPGARQVAVLDRTRNAVISAWEVSGAKANFPMVLDETSRRLFVGTRTPALMLVFDIDSGKIVARQAIGEDPDDLFFDAGRKRVYVVCGTGRVDVFRQESPDFYTSQGSVKTSSGARTGLYVPEQGRLYVAGPARGGSPAQIFVFRIQ